MIGANEENLDVLELNLALRFLICPFMEKKLKGLTEIKEIIESMTDKDLNIRRRYRFLTSESLAKWIVSNRIIEIVLENSHEEMVKRVSSIFIFLASTKYLTNEHLDLL